MLPVALIAIAARLNVSVLKTEECDDSASWRRATQRLATRSLCIRKASADHARLYGDEHSGAARRNQFRD